MGKLISLVLLLVQLLCGGFVGCNPLWIGEWRSVDLYCGCVIGNDECAGFPVPGDCLERPLGESDDSLLAKDDGRVPSQSEELSPYTERRRYGI